MSGLADQVNISEPRPPKRPRTPSGFNNFCKNKKKKEGETSKEQFKRFSIDWSTLSNDQKKTYTSAVPNQNKVDRPKAWKAHLEYACQAMNYCDSLIPTPCFMVVFNPITKEAEFYGSGNGLEFIKSHSHLVMEFQCQAMQEADEESTKEPPVSTQKQVQNLFNKLFSPSSSPNLGMDLGMTEYNWQ